MTIKPIRNDDDLKKVFRRLEKIFQAEEGTAQADERDVLVTLVEAYENKHYDFGPADPVEAIKAKWRRPKDIKDQYANASICGHNRVVFNVGGNKYRLVVEVQYQAGIVWVKFVGTHAQYDRIDVESVNDN